MLRKHVLTAVLLMMMLMMLLLLLGMMPVLSLAAPGLSRLQQEGTNVLLNPGFEGLVCSPNSGEGWCDDNWGRATHDGSVHDNIFTPQGWVSWWRKGDNYGQPEIKTIPKVDPFIGPPKRINSGKYAVLFFTYYRNQDGGFYQVHEHYAGNILGIIGRSGHPTGDLEHGAPVTAHQLGVRGHIAPLTPLGYPPVLVVHAHTRHRQREYSQ